MKKLYVILCLILCQVKASEFNIDNNPQESSQEIHIHTLQEFKTLFNQVNPLFKDYTPQEQRRFFKVKLTDTTIVLKQLLTQIKETPVNTELQKFENILKIEIELLKQLIAETKTANKIPKH